MPNASTTWLASLLLLAPMALAHCGPDDGRGRDDGDDDGGPPGQQLDASDAAPTKPEAGTKPVADSGGKPPAGGKPGAEGGTIADDAGTQTGMGTGTGTSSGSGSTSDAGTSAPCVLPWWQCIEHRTGCDDARGAGIDE
ncbi:MAG: hypothetical protein ACRENE_24275 [Polyangiaceae bacterium]